jgi:4-diphosphocytidyl-2-C-methyl-D-erythritol kinase
VIEARAKLNLGLAVGPRRPDGFHDLATLFQSVSLADTLEIRPRRRGFSLAVRFEDASRRGEAGSRARSIPSGRSNLVLRAARLLAERARLERGAAFRLTKRIPSESGLGGGSADAAAAIRGLCVFHGIRLPIRERLELAAAVGSDVPFALLGGTALGFGRGERLIPARLSRGFTALVAVPTWRISTAEAFARLDRRKNILTRWRANLRSAQLLGRKRLRAETWLRLGNTFEEVLGERLEEFLSLSERLRRAGATRVRMTGSGSAVFGILEAELPAREAVRRFEGSEAIFVVRPRVAGLKLNFV